MDKINELLANLNQGFSEFKASQENKINTLQTNDDESKQQILTLQEETRKTAEAVDSINTQLAAHQLNGKVESKNRAAIEAATAFMRSGEIRADLQKDPDGNGGYLVPTEWDRTITNKLQERSPLRQVFFVQSTSKPAFEKLYNMHGATSGWVGETEARPKTDTPTFKSLKFETGEIYANPAATQQILDDAEINLEQFLANEVQAEFAIQENKAFISGDGTNGKPVGLLTYATGGTSAAKHPLGAIEVVNSGNAAEITADAVLDLIYSLPAEYSQNAAFLMNRKTLAVVRKLKDGQGNYLWQPSYQAGQPSTLCGYPVQEIGEMPDVAANALPIAFGDFKRGYMILDRIGVRILRDPYTNKPFVQFYTTKRVGGGVTDPQSMRLLKVSA